MLQVINTELIESFSNKDVVILVQMWVKVMSWNEGPCLMSDLLMMYTVAFSSVRFLYQVTGLNELFRLRSDMFLLFWWYI